MEIPARGRNLWKLARPDASGVLVDAADYYRAFYEAASQAKKSILLSGWQFDRGVPLLRGQHAPAGAEVRSENTQKFPSGLRPISVAYRCRWCPPRGVQP